MLLLEEHIITVVVAVVVIKEQRARGARGGKQGNTLHVRRHYAKPNNNAQILLARAVVKKSKVVARVVKVRQRSNQDTRNGAQTQKEQRVDYQTGYGVDAGMLAPETETANVYAAPEECHYSLGIETTV